MPPFQRKTLVLIGAQGVGRRSLKNRLTVLNPLRYGTTVPCECPLHVWDTFLFYIYKSNIFDIKYYMYTHTI